MLFFVEALTQEKVTHLLEWLQQIAIQPLLHESSSLHPHSVITNQVKQVMTKDAKNRECIDKYIESHSIIRNQVHVYPHSM